MVLLFNKVFLAQLFNSIKNLEKNYNINTEDVFGYEASINRLNIPKTRIKNAIINSTNSIF